MEVKRLNQNGMRHFKREWCNQDVTANYFPRGKPWMCKSTANWTIDGVPYCNRHAGMLALQHMEIKN